MPFIDANDLQLIKCSSDVAGETHTNNILYNIPSQIELIVIGGDSPPILKVRLYDWV